MFAVGYGTYEFGKKVSNGSVALFTFKNVKYPELTIPCEDAVMSLDFHPVSPALLAVGLYNGSVLVFDVRNKSPKPIYCSSIKSKKHTGKFKLVRLASIRLISRPCLANQVEPVEHQESQFLLNLL